MDEVDFDKYSQESVHFFSRTVPHLLATAVRQMGASGRMVDVGCGDGHLVWALKERGLLKGDSQVIGVDLSPVRVQRFKALTGFDAVVAKGQHMPELPDGSVDLAMSTMVIEHVPDDQAYAFELARIVRPGGWLYITTVIRKRGAWYFRKAPDGRRVLDPTHLREYAAPFDVVKLVEAAGFEIQEQRLERLVFPVAHPLLRWWHARWPVDGVQRFFLDPSRAWLEALGLPIPRYRSIELLARRPEKRGATSHA